MKAKFYRSVADRYIAMLATESHPALRVHWMRKAKAAITKAQLAETKGE